MSTLPAKYKPLSNAYRTAQQFEKKDTVVAYWARFYCVQEAMKLDSKDKDGRMWILEQMDWLEQVKKAHAGNEAISQEVVGQAHFENATLAIFARADAMDRKAEYTANVPKIFALTASLITIMNIFGELTDDWAEKKKYALYKTVDIMKCLKEGRQPVPGPPGGFQDEEDELDQLGEEYAPSSTYTQPQEPTTSNYQPPAEPTYTPPIDPASQSVPARSDPVSVPSPIAPAPGFYPNQAQKDKASKNAKFAVSSLTYDDVPGAISFLQKSLRLLQTGQE